MCFRDFSLGRHTLLRVARTRGERPLNLAGGQRMDCETSPGARGHIRAIWKCGAPHHPERESFQHFCRRNGVSSRVCNLRRTHLSRSLRYRGIRSCSRLRILTLVDGKPDAATSPEQLRIGPDLGQCRDEFAYSWLCGCPASKLAEPRATHGLDLLLCPRRGETGTL